MGLEEGGKKNFAEIDRLRNILNGYVVREKLRMIRGNVWMEGFMGGYVGYDESIKGNVVELDLRSEYPDIKFSSNLKAVGSDIFYPKDVNIYTSHTEDSKSYSILTVGAASVNSLESIKIANPINEVSQMGDYVYIGFRVVDKNDYVIREMGKSTFCQNNKKLRINGLADKEVFTFMEKALKEFTKDEYLPENLRLIAHIKRRDSGIK